MMRRPSLWLAVGLIVAYAVLIALLHPAGAAQKLPAGSSQSAAPSGSRAVAQLWARLGLPLTRWDDPPELLPAQPGVFVSVEPQVAPYTSGEAAALLRWVHAGGVLVWADDSNDNLLKRLGLRMQSLATTQTVERLVETSTSPGAAATVHSGLKLPVMERDRPNRIDPGLRHRHSGCRAGRRRHPLWKRRDPRLVDAGAVGEPRHRSGRQLRPGLGADRQSPAAVGRVQPRCAEQHRLAGAVHSRPLAGAGVAGCRAAAVRVARQYALWRDCPGCG